MSKEKFKKINSLDAIAEAIKEKSQVVLDEKEKETPLLDNFGKKVKKPQVIKVVKEEEKPEEDGSLNYEDYRNKKKKDLKVNVGKVVDDIVALDEITINKRLAEKKINDAIIKKASMVSKINEKPDSSKGKKSKIIPTSVSVESNSKFEDNDKKNWDELQKIFEKEQNQKIAYIANLLRENKINQVVLHSEDGDEPGINPKTKEPYGLKMRPDLDARTALWILNELTKEKLENFYSEDSVTSFIPKGATKEDLDKQNKGIRLFIDVSGNWLKVEKEGKEILNIFIDHHGSGKREPTSATEMMLKIVEQAGLVKWKEEPKWLYNFKKLVNDVDNLTYLEDRDKSGKRIFDKTYFKEQWPQSVYALAEVVPFEMLKGWFESGKVKDPDRIFTKKDLEGEIGQSKVTISLEEMSSRKQEIPLEVREELLKTKKIKNINHKFLKKDFQVGGKLSGIKMETTVADICKWRQERAERTIEAVEKAKDYAEKSKLNTWDTSLGRMIYHNFFKLEKPSKDESNFNTIDYKLGFLATRAIGYDTIAISDQKHRKFHLNSRFSLRKTAENLNKIAPGTKDVRGTFIFSPQDGTDITEQEFLNVIDPQILGTAKKSPDTTGIEKEKQNKIDEEKREKERAQDLENFWAETDDMFKRQDKETKEIEKQIKKLEIAYQKQVEKDRKDFAKGLSPVNQ